MPMYFPTHLKVHSILITDAVVEWKEPESSEGTSTKPPAHPREPGQAFVSRFCGLVATSVKHRNDLGSF